MNKRTIISITLFVIMSLSVNAQRYGVPNLKEYDYEPFHFGFLLGINQMDFSIKQDYNSLYDLNSPSRITTTYTDKQVGSLLTGRNYYLTSVLPSPNSGFTIGIVSSIRLSDHFNFRIIPSISFGSRNLQYSFVESTTPNDPISVNKNIPSTLLELPLIFRYRGVRIQNACPFIQAGLKYAYDLELKTTNTNTIDEPHFSGFSFINNDVHLKKSDIYGVIGVGFDFYFDWFKMGVEGTMNYGLNDVLNRSTNQTIYENGITSLKSKVFQISVTFE